MSNRDIRPWRWIVSESAVEKDITSRKFLLWGCGKYIFDFTHDLQLDDFMVIDSDQNKYGRQILLNNKRYMINSPEVLNEVKISEYYIVITVLNGDIINEIKQMIYVRYSDWKDNLCECTELKREYTNITSACICDPFIHNKIHEGRVSIKLPEYIENAESILENNLGPVEKMNFSVIRHSSRIILQVNYMNDKYFLYFPYNKNYYLFYSENNVKQNYEIRKHLHINEKLVIYEDDKGFMLSRYMKCDDDFADQKVAKKILDQIRDVHNSFEKIDSKMTIHDGVNELERQILGEQEKNSKWFSKLHDVVIPETKIYEEKLIHGDLSYGNVLHNDEGIEIIDWTFMEMGDPIFDVCLFYYFISLHWNYNFYDVLCMYYEGAPTEAEFKHAWAWLIFIIYWKYLEELDRHGPRRDEIFNGLKIKLDEYK